jgi:two-component system alkaline phosphatase synthesis response regulator PhoP
VKTILVVDDEYVICDLLAAALSDEGYQVVTASNGREAWSRLEEFQPNLILCDVMMPLVDGRVLCNAVRADVKYRALPFILMSAAGSSTLKEDCDYSDFVRKPFDLDEIVETVRAWIGEP